MGAPGLPRHPDYRPWMNRAAQAGNVMGVVHGPRNRPVERTLSRKLRSLGVDAPDETPTGTRAATSSFVPPAGPPVSLIAERGKADDLAKVHELGHAITRTKNYGQGARTPAQMDSPLAWMTPMELLQVVQGGLGEAIESVRKGTDLSKPDTLSEVPSTLLEIADALEDTPSPENRFVDYLKQKPLSPENRALAMRVAQRMGQYPMDSPSLRSGSLQVQALPVRGYQADDGGGDGGPSDTPPKDQKLPDDTSSLEDVSSQQTVTPAKENPSDQFAPPPSPSLSIGTRRDDWSQDQQPDSQQPSLFQRAADVANQFWQQTAVQPAQQWQDASARANAQLAPANTVAAQVGAPVVRAGQWLQSPAQITPQSSVAEQAKWMAQNVMSPQDVPETAMLSTPSLLGMVSSTRLPAELEEIAPGVIRKVGGLFGAPKAEVTRVTGVQDLPRALGNIGPNWGKWAQEYARTGAVGAYELGPKNVATSQMLQDMLRSGKVPDAESYRVPLGGSPAQTTGFRDPRTGLPISVLAQRGASDELQVAHELSHSMTRLKNAVEGRGELDSPLAWMSEDDLKQAIAPDSDIRKAIEAVRPGEGLSKDPAEVIPGMLELYDALTFRTPGNRYMSYLAENPLGEEAADLVRDVGSRIRNYPSELTARGFSLPQWSGFPQ